MACQPGRSGVRLALVLAAAFGGQAGRAVRSSAIFEAGREGEVAGEAVATGVRKPAAVEAASALQGQEEMCRGLEAVRKRAAGSHRRSRSGREARQRRARRRRCASLARGGAAARGPPRGEASEDEPWRMTAGEKLALQGGWLLQFAALALAAAAFCELAERLGRGPAKAGGAAVAAGPEPPSERDSAIFDLLWGQGAAGTCVSACIIVLSLANFMTYVLQTEAEYRADWRHMGWDFDPIMASRIRVGAWDFDAILANRILENVTLFVFLPITVLRINTIHCHPDWRVFGSAARWRYVMTDIYIISELVALALTVGGFLRFYFFYSEYDHVNLMFIFFVRSLDMLDRSGSGLGVRRLRHMIMDDGKLLVTAFVIGVVTWLIMSGLYFTANHNNEAEDAVWAVATYDGEPWSKFESIPSTMWFVLLNLLAEHPLAGAHETLMSRVWVCVVCIFAMPIFAIPASILQSALFKAEEEEAQQEAALGISSVAAPEPEGGEPEEAHGFWAGAATAVLVFSSVVVYFYHTAAETEHSVILGIPVHVSAATWAVVDMSASVLFLLEWLYRTAKRGPAHAATALGAIDLLAWLPGVLHVALRWRLTSAAASAWWQGGSVLRVLKMERYLHSWRDIVEVIRENKGILGATYLLSIFVWMFFTILTYATEATNPDPGMREVFGSGMRSFWAEIINLHGEWPWADYTCTGKAMGVFIGVFSIMLFCVPISIFGDAFTDKIQAEVGSDCEKFDRQPWPHLCRPQAAGLRREVYDAFYAHLHSLPAMAERRFVVLRALAFVCVGAATLTTVLSTLPKEYFGGRYELWWGVFFVTDLLATAFFVLELAGRVVATGWRHPASFVGLCDALSLAAFLVTLVPAGRYAAFHPSYQGRDVWEIWDDVLVLLRLLRLFSLESYLGALQVIRNVFAIYHWPLLRAGTALVSTWFIHATLLYSCERSDRGSEEMQYRYRSIISALQYSIVHLFGDFPETEYTLPSKVVHCLGILGGIAITGTFCGVFSGCFISYLDKDRSKEMKEAACRQAIVFMAAVRAFQRAFRRRRARLARGSAASAAAPLPRWRRRCREVACGMTPGGRSVLYFFHATLLLAILNSLVSSLPEAESVELTCLCVSLLCTLVFVAEYVIRVAAYPGRALSFWRLLDLACCLPGLLDLCRFLVFGRGGAPSLECLMEAISMVRAVRILEFQYFAREVTMIGRAVRDAIPQLAVPGYVALCVWIQTSALFMWLENYYKDDTPNMAEDMESVPHAMYWCCIFLTGEWANIDFTYAGSRLCIFYMLFGIAMFSIPIGILVEAVQSTIQKAAEEEKRFAILMQMSAQEAGAEPAAATFAEALRRASAVETVASARRASAVSRKSVVRTSLGGSLIAGGAALRASAARSLRPSQLPTVESNPVLTAR